MPITDAPLGLFMGVIIYLVVVFVVLHVATETASRRAVVPAILGIGGWLSASALLPLLLAVSGAGPRAQFFVFIPFLVCTVWAGFSAYGLRIAQAPMWALVGLHVFRAPLEVVLDLWAHAGAVPVQMTYRGANFDIVTGVLAGILSLAVIFQGDAVPRWALIAFNVIGLMFLVNILVIVNLSSPTILSDVFGGYQNDPDMLPAFSFPAVWIATAALMPALALHIAVLRHLTRLSVGVTQ